MRPAFGWTNTSRSSVRLFWERSKKFNFRKASLVVSALQPNRFKKTRWNVVEHHPDISWIGTNQKLFLEKNLAIILEPLTGFEGEKSFTINRHLQILHPWNCTRDACTDGLDGSHAAIHQHYQQILQRIIDRASLVMEKG